MTNTEPDIICACACVIGARDGVADAAEGRKRMMYNRTPAYVAGYNKGHEFAKTLHELVV